MPTAPQNPNAHQVLTWGVGAAMYPTKLTAEGIAQVLAQKVLTESCQQRVQSIQQQLDTESGIDCAADLITSWL